MTELTVRQKNIVRRMCNGEEFYFSLSPRITMREVNELSALGFRIQVADPIHEPKRASRLVKKEFEERARELGIID